MEKRGGRGKKRRFVFCGIMRYRQTRESIGIAFFECGPYNIFFATLFPFFPFFCKRGPRMQETDPLPPLYQLQFPKFTRREKKQTKLERKKNLLRA